MLNKLSSHPERVFSWPFPKCVLATFEREISVLGANEASSLFTHRCKPFPSNGVQRFQITTFFLIVPSPLHGTSHNILSNTRFRRLDPRGGSCGTLMLGIFDASRFITMNDGEGRRADWWMRRCVRFGSVSLAMTMPDGIEDELTLSSACSASRSCAVWNRTFMICNQAKRCRFPPWSRGQHTYPSPAPVLSIILRFPWVQQPTL